MNRMVYRDRQGAGTELAKSLAGYARRTDTVILGLTRGGVPVASAIASLLSLPLDAFVVRKLGVPGHDELAMGAIATGGVRVVNDDVVEALRIDEPVLDRIAERESRELARREHIYRGQRPPIEVRGRTVILVDDGLATGSTMRAAVEALRRRDPTRIVIAVPTGSARGCEALHGVVAEVVCPLRPEPFVAVGLYYRDFGEVTDDEVRGYLDAARDGS
jgi:putative phosphoribosyl transferase